MLDMVKPGLYELQCEPSGHYLDSRADALHNGLYDDVLQMQEVPSINGKVRIQPILKSRYGLTTPSYSGRSVVWAVATPSNKSGPTCIVQSRMAPNSKDNRSF